MQKPAPFFADLTDRLTPEQAAWEGPFISHALLRSLEWLTGVLGITAAAVTTLCLLSHV